MNEYKKYYSLFGSKFRSFEEKKIPAVSASQHKSCTVKYLG